MRSFIDVDPNSHFPIQNLPYGAFITAEGDIHLCSRIGDYVIDLYVLDEEGFFDGEHLNDQLAFLDSTLNYFMSLGQEAWKEARETLIDLFNDDNALLKNNEGLQSRVLIPIEEVTLVLPIEINNYTDFYSSEQHARNIGKIFRGNDELMPNWKHIPIGYHGRASSIVLSGTNVPRPNGQILNASNEPEFKPSQKIDFELEMGFIMGTGNTLGEPIDINQAQNHIFGMVLVNDWSARDIQRWEYQPLGPFLSKSWATSISPWIVTMEALSPFKIDAPVQNPAPLNYLKEDNRITFDINLEVQLGAAQIQKPTTISKTNYKYLYWSMAQQLTHHASNGCNIQTGDLYASGTISGNTPNSYGSMMELSWNGEQPVELESGENRTFLKDGDQVIMTGYSQGDGYRVGFGEVSGVVLPAT